MIFFIFSEMSRNGGSVLFLVIRFLDETTSFFETVPTLLRGPHLLCPGGFFSGGRDPLRVFGVCLVSVFLMLGTRLF